MRRRCRARCAALPPVTFVTAEFRVGVYRARATCLWRRVIFLAPDKGVVEPKRATGVLPSDCKLKGDAMRNFSRGIWTCAALYVALGLIGILLLAGEPGIATSSEGYGIATTASPTPLH